MDRRNKSIQPGPNMEWSEKHSMWVDIDNRTPEQKAKDDKIFHHAELQYVIEQIEGIAELSLEYEMTKETDEYGDKMRMFDIKNLVQQAKTHLGGL